MNANQILQSLDAAELHQRLVEIDREKQALLILHRAAIRLEQQGKRPPERPATEAAR
jgi:hypothetical protein